MIRDGEPQRPEVRPELTAVVQQCLQRVGQLVKRLIAERLEDGSVAKSFDLLKKWLRSCHINELWRAPSPSGRMAGQPLEKATPGFPSYAQPYPYRELFQLFRSVNYSRYTFCEIPSSPEPVRLMRYYRALWQWLAA